MHHKKHHNEATDMISSLPVPILHHILSFLPFKDVTRTRVLSKTWNGVFDSYPTLDFDEYRFNFSREEFISHVDSSLNSFCGQNVEMLKLSLLMTSRIEPITSSLIKWLKMALENGVEEVYVGTSCYVWSPTPRDVEMSPLKFEFCSEKYRTFDSLKKIVLENIILDESTFENLFVICPLIEDMKLYNTSGLKRLHIPKVERLRSVSIMYPNKVEHIDIETDSIRELSLTSTICIPLHDLASRYPQLETLRIIGCRCDNVIEIISPSLKILQLQENGDYDGIKIDTPNLCFLKYIMDTEDEVPLDDINIKAPCQWEIKLVPNEDTIETWFVDLKNFLAGSKQVIEFSLYVNWSEYISFSPEVSEEINLSPIPVVEKLCFECDGDIDIRDYDVICLDDDKSDEMLEENYAAVLNGILWCCRPKLILLEERKKFTKFIREEFEKKGDSLLCCSLTQAKCWRHDLKEVKLHQSAIESEYGEICFELTW